MKKKLIISVLSIHVFLFFPATSHAGTFLFGGKFWYAYWDSAVLNWFEKDITAGFEFQGLNLDSDVDTGKGYLTGPLVGYQTEDGTWSFSFAAMGFSDFDQDWDGEAGTMMQLEADVDADRKDFDFAVNYSLAKHGETFSLLKYLSVYAGYKYQKVDYDLKLKYNTLLGDRSFKYKLDADVHMPTVGLGIVYPVLDKLALGLQGGIGIALIDLDLKDPNGDTFDISPDASIVYTGELTISYVPIKHLILQAGFRAQAWYLEARSPERIEKTRSRDTTYGPTVSIVFAY